MTRSRRGIFACGLVFSISASVGAAFNPGDTAPDFAAPDYRTGEPVHLRDFAGQIVLLDFFAYWCPHCQASSPVVQTQIQQYYSERGGNPAGIPVQLLSLAVINNRAGNDAFIQNAGLDLVLDDSARAGFNVYGYGYIPMFVLINGVADANYRQWEVLYSDAGFGSGDEVMFRSLIDGIVRMPEPTCFVMLLVSAILLRRGGQRGISSEGMPR